MKVRLCRHTFVIGQNWEKPDFCCLCRGTNSRHLSFHLLLSNRLVQQEPLVLVVNRRLRFVWDERRSSCPETLRDRACFHGDRGTLQRHFQITSPLDDVMLFLSLRLWCFLLLHGHSTQLRPKERNHCSSPRKFGY